MKSRSIWIGLILFLCAAGKAAAQKSSGLSRETSFPQIVLTRLPKRITNLSRHRRP